MIEILLNKSYENNIKKQDNMKKEIFLLVQKANFLDNEVLKKFYTEFENEFNQI
jgi:hypothetical protein